MTTRAAVELRRTSPALLLVVVGHEAGRLLRAAHEGHGLTPRQFHLLALLHDHGPLGQRELGDLFSVDPSVLVTLLNPLDERGLVTRSRDPADRRRHVVALTAAGQAMVAEGLAAQRAAEEELFAALSPAEREQLRCLLQRMDPAPEPDACG